MLSVANNYLIQPPILVRGPNIRVVVKKRNWHRSNNTPYSTEQGIISAEQGILSQEQGILSTKTEIIA
jgi:hypothetical protein